MFSLPKLPHLLLVALTFSVSAHTHAVTTPSPSEAVGFIKGDLDISGGAAHYSAPIAVPAGIAGMEPMLSINYSSQSGNGLLGMGWNLSGVSLVHRCGSTLVQDGINRAVKLDNSDNYCIDGQRLVPIRGSKGQNNTEYRTETANFSKIISYGRAGNGPQWFKVWTKAGQIMEFGHTADSRIEAQGKSTVLNWAVNEISDTLGNEIHFNYHEINANSEFVPKEISYGPGFNNKVKFSYTTYSNISGSKVAGSNVKSTRRLSKIETFAQNQPVQNWTFSFTEQSKKPAKLTALRLCAADGKCLPRTQITWGSYAPVLNAKTDAQVVDFNGDGIQDSYRLFRSGNYVYLNVRYQNEQGNAPETRVLSRLPMASRYVMHPYGEGEYWWEPYMPSIVIGDYNGDGLTDISLSSGYRYRSTGSGFSRLYNSNNRYFVGAYWNASQYDFNGDQVSDGFWFPQPLKSTYYDNYRCSHKLTPQFILGKSNGSYSVEPQSSQSSAWGLDGSADWGRCSYHGAEDTYVKASTRTSFNVLDINNDGNDDLKLSNGPVFLGTPDGFYKYNSLSALRNDTNNKLDLVTKISNNTDTQITYASILDKSVYPNQNESISYPNKDLRGTYLVKKVIADTGMGEQQTTSYQYGGAKVNQIGRGNLGFAWISEKDHTTGSSVRSEFNQTHPYIGMVQNTESRQANNTLISRSESTYAHLNLQSGKVKFPYVKTSREFSYSLSGQLISTVQVDNNQFDSYGNLEKVTVTTTGGGKTYRKITESQYTNNSDKWHLGRLTKSSVTHIDANGQQQIRSSAFSYDNTTGLLTQEIIQPNSQLSKTTTTTYDRYGNKIETRLTATGESETRLASTLFDSHGQFPVSSRNGLGHQDSKTTDPRYGVLLTQTGPNGLTTRWEYDSFGNQTTERRADGTQSTVQRKWLNQCPQQPQNALYCIISQPAGNPVVNTYYDRLNRKIFSHTTGFNGKTVYQEYQYNNKGQLYRATLPYYEGETPTQNLHWVTTTFDNLGRKVQVSRPVAEGEQQITQFGYSGLQSWTISPKGIKKLTQRDVLGRVTDIKEDNGASVIRNTYDAIGNLTQSNANGFIVNNQYNTLGQKTHTADPSMGTWLYTYNGFGELIQQQDAKGQTTTYAYDTLGRKTTRTAPDGTTQWIYDTAQQGIGKLASITKTGNSGNSEEHYTYDNLGRPSTHQQQIDGKDYTSRTTYDQYSRVNTVYTPDNFEYSHSYKNGFLQKIAMPTTQFQDYDYDQLNQSLESYGEQISELQAKILQHREKEAEYSVQAEKYTVSADYWKSQSESQTANAERLTKTANTLQAQANAHQRASNSYRSQAAYFAKRFGNAYFSYFRTSGGRTLFRYSQCISKNWKGRCSRTRNHDIAINTSLLNTTSIGVTRGVRGRYSWKRSYGISGVYPTRFYSALASKKQHLANYYANRASTYSNSAQTYADNAARYQRDADNYQQKAADTYAQAREQADYVSTYSQRLSQLMEAREQIQNTLSAQNTQTGNKLVWFATDRDATGRLISELTGNGLHTTRDFDPYSGQLNTLTTGYSASGDELRHLNYTYDQHDNVLSRHDAINSVRENYQYDRFDRVIQANLQSTGYSHSTDYGYDLRGNMLTKSDTGSMQYNSRNQLIALTRTAGQNQGRNATYTYDANGNQLAGDGRNIQWNSFNKPQTISTDKRVVSHFLYGTNNQRIQQIANLNDGSVQKTNYIGKGYEETRTTDILGKTTLEKKHYLYADGKMIGMHIRSKTTQNGATTNAPDKFRYLHRDALDSVDMITNNSGQVVERQSFDPFGKRRQITGQAIQADYAPKLTNRGFTGHEHLDHLGLIHMNARLYDAETARFLSADTFIQAPSMAQNYNRYSYVMNNPLKYTDPSGHFFKSIFKAIGNLIRGVVKFVKKYWRPILAIAAAYYLGTAFTNSIFTSGMAAAQAAGATVTQLSAMASALYTKAAVIGGAIGGFTGGLISSGGDLSAALVGGFTGGAAGFIGAYGNGIDGVGFSRTQKAFAHGAVGGVSSKVQGGKFGSGFISSAFSKAISGKVHGLVGKNPIAGGVAMSLIGGTASALGGGKFANGARSTALQYLFNEASSRSWQSWKRIGLEAVSFIFSTGEAALGVALMMNPATFAGGAAIASHATLGMTNSIIAMNGEIRGVETQGVLESIGGHVAGKNGEFVGKVLDGASNASGIVRGAVKAGSDSVTIVQEFDDEKYSSP